ncbi:hypothetical protein ACE6H2_025861 [Prunus campanulata]
MADKLKDLILVSKLAKATETAINLSSQTAHGDVAPQEINPKGPTIEGAKIASKRKKQYRRSLGLGEELHSQEVASGSHGSPVWTVRSHHVAFAAQKDISLGSYDTLHIVSEGSLSKKKRLASNSFTKVPHYGESDVTDVLCDVPVTISLGLSRGKEILGAQTKEVVPDNMTDECIGSTHNVNSLPPSCHEGSSSSGKKGFKRMRGGCICCYTCCSWSIQNMRHSSRKNYYLFSSNPGKTSISGAFTAIAGMRIYTYLHLKQQSSKAPRQASSLPKSKLSKANGSIHEGNYGSESV